MIGIQTIEGLTATGKTSVAEIVGKELGLPVFNTGIIFRAVTLALQRQEVGHAEIPDFIATTSFVIDEGAICLDGIDYSGLAGTVDASKASQLNKAGGVGLLEKIFDAQVPKNCIIEGKNLAGRYVTTSQHILMATIPERVMRKRAYDAGLGRATSLREALEKIQTADRNDIRLVKTGIDTTTKIIDTTHFSLVEVAEVVKLSIIASQNADNHA